MATIASSFRGVAFLITFPFMPPVPQVPKWIDRNEQVPRGTVQMSITGRPAIQEMTRKWKPITLEFRAANLPPALMTQSLLNAFNGAIGAGVQTLQLEGFNHRVIVDWRIANPVQYVEVTPTGEGDYVVNQAGFPGRLYEGVIHFIELL